MGRLGLVMGNVLSFYFLFLFSAIGLYFSFSGNDFDNVVIFIVLFLIGYAVDVIRKKRIHGWVNPETFFVSFFSIFHFSYIILYYFNVTDYDREVFYHEESLNRAIGYSLFCLTLFILGYRLVGQDRLKKRLSYPGSADGFNLVFISKFFITVSILFFWLPIISVLPLVYGNYKALISVGEISPIGRLFWVGQYIGYFSISLYYVSRRFSGLDYKGDNFKWVVA